MSNRRQYSSQHYLPDNPTWVEFPRSDGDQNSWPMNTTKQVDHAGHVNFFRPVPLDEPGLSVKWRVEVAAALAVLLNYPTGPTYVLKSWPEGYAMFDHQKGIAHGPRHDAYLFGSKARYRSVPEFIPHAFWLFNDPTLDRGNCQCKYCSKKAQREITSTMTFLPQTRHTGTPGLSRLPKQQPSARGRGKGREQQRPPHKPYAAVQRVPKPIRLSIDGPQNPISQEKNADLRAACSNSSTRLKRLFREGELLWCHLDPPIRSSKDDGVSIVFWPGLVEEVKLKSSALPRNIVAEGEEAVPWTIEQSTLYKMRLLAVSHSYTIPDLKVLPYQAYAPPNDLILAIQELAGENLEVNAEVMATFNPCPPAFAVANGASDSGLAPTEANFSDAVAPYSLAVQIAAKLSKFWSLTDEWSFKYTLPANAEPANALALDTPTSEHTSISAAINKSFAERQISGASRDMSEKELQSLGVRKLGVPPVPGHTVVQKRFQGLWWGAERIWTDELVRLKWARKQVAPDGTPDIYPPSWPSQKTLEYKAKLPQDPDVTEEALGAGSRGMFMKLEGLFLVEIPREDGSGMRRECRVSGMLYELADDDWPDPFEEEHKAYAVEKEEQRLAELKIVTPAMEARVAAAAAANGGTANGNALLSAPGLKPSAGQNLFSHPITAPAYPLPAPPSGLKFRPILTPGHEAVISLPLISGRYYPRILTHPLLQPFVLEGLTNLQQGKLSRADHLWALEGLSPGRFNSVDPGTLKNSRLVMMRDADREARQDVEEAARAMKNGVELDVQLQEDDMEGMYMDVE